MQHGLLASRLQFEDDSTTAPVAAPCRAAKDRGAIDVSPRVPNERAANGLFPIGAVGDGAKLVEHGFLPVSVRLGRQFKHYATTVEPTRGAAATLGCTVKIPCSVKEQNRPRIRPIWELECVQHR